MIGEGVVHINFWDQFDWNDETNMINVHEQHDLDGLVSEDIWRRRFGCITRMPVPGATVAFEVKTVAK